MHSYYHLLPYPQCSLVLPQPVSKDAVELFAEIVVLLEILIIVSILLPIFVVFQFTFCANTMLAS